MVCEMNNRNYLLTSPQGFLMHSSGAPILASEVFPGKAYRRQTVLWACH